MSDLVDRLKSAAESWRRTDCMIAREVLSEAALLDEAAAEIKKLTTALEDIASGLSVLNPYHVANEALGRAVTP